LPILKYDFGVKINEGSTPRAGDITSSGHIVYREGKCLRFLSAGAAVIKRKNFKAARKHGWRMSPAKYQHDDKKYLTVHKGDFF
jgi:hypothetical protein